MVDDANQVYWRPDMSTLKRLMVAMNMPALNHRQDNPMRIEPGESAAADWLVQQPELRALLFELARTYGLIAYDERGGAWRGATDTWMFVPYTEEEILGELAEPKKQTALYQAVATKYLRPGTDSFTFRMALALLERRGKVVTTEFPGFRGKAEKWYGRPGEEFLTVKRTEKKRTSMTIVDLAETLRQHESGLMAGEIVALFSTQGVARSTVYLKIKEATAKGRIAQAGKRWIALPMAEQTG